MLRQRRDADIMRVLGPIEIRSAQILIFLVRVGAKYSKQPALLLVEPEEVDSWTLNVATRLRHNCVIC